jgi:hypothetical protein
MQFEITGGLSWVKAEHRLAANLAAWNNTAFIILHTEAKSLAACILRPKMMNLSSMPPERRTNLRGEGATKSGTVPASFTGRNTNRHA